MRKKAMYEEARSAGVSTARIDSSMATFKAGRVWRAFFLSILALVVATAAGAAYLIQVGPNRASQLAGAETSTPEGEAASLASAFSENSTGMTSETALAAAAVSQDTAASAGDEAGLSTPLDDAGLFGGVASSDRDAAEAFTDPTFVEPATIEAPTTSCVDRLTETASRLRILFVTNSRTIPPDQLPIVLRIAEAAAQCPEARVEIRGHTDGTGTDLANLQLSWARADAVLAAIETAGYDVGSYTTVGYGARQPLADDPTLPDEPSDVLRRVEFVVFAQPQATMIASPLE